MVYPLTYRATFGYYLFIDREWAGTKKYELSAHYTRVDNLKHTAA